MGDHDPVGDFFFKFFGERWAGQFLADFSLGLGDSKMVNLVRSLFHRGQSLLS